MVPLTVKSPVTVKSLGIVTSLGKANCILLSSIREQIICCALPLNVISSTTEYDDVNLNVTSGDVAVIARISYSVPIVDPPPPTSKFLTTPSVPFNFMVRTVLEVASNTTSPFWLGAILDGGLSRLLSCSGNLRIVSDIITV